MSPFEDLAPPVRRAARALCLLAVSGLLLHVVVTLSRPGAVSPVGETAYHLTILGCVALCWLRAATARDGRGPWIVLALAVTCWDAGELWWRFEISGMAEEPFPALSDAAWL